MVALAIGAPAARAAPGDASPSAAPAVATSAQAPASAPAWSDEFDGGALDLSRWSHRATGPRHDGILVPDAVSVGDGSLTIKTYTRSGSHYSGMISTQKLGDTGFEQRYGYFEARVRFDSTPGQWSAFWLQSPTIGDPPGDPATAGVEMDIAEHRASCPPWPPEPPPGPNGTAQCFGGDVTHRIQQALIWDGYAYGTSTHPLTRISSRPSYLVRLGEPMRSPAKSRCWRCGRVAMDDVRP